MLRMKSQFLTYAFWSAVRWWHHFACVLSVLYACLVCGCSGNLDCPEDDDGICFRLSLSVAMPETRGYGSGDALSAGEMAVNENYIDPDDLWIAAFDEVTGERICVLYPAGGGEVSSEISGDMLSVRLGSGIIHGGIYIAALANWSRYGIARDDLEKVVNKDMLKSLTFSFPPVGFTPGSDVAECHVWDVLPMSGSVTTDVTQAKELEVAVYLSRALSKIEISDNHDGEIRIESAVLSRYAASGKVMGDDLSPSDMLLSAEEGMSDLQLDKIDDGTGKTLFYTYVPEVSLGDVSSGFRSITLRLSDGTSSEICLINYVDGEPSSAPDEGWDSLERNRIYRFNIKGIVSSSPEVEILSKIRVCWYETASSGKFSDWNENLFFIKNGTSQILNYYTTRSEILSTTVTVPGTDITFDLKSHYSELKLDDNEKFEDLMYLLSEDEDLDMYYQDFMRPLHKDVIRFENIDGITYCWLNNMTYAYVLYTDIYHLNTFQPERIHRIYWIGDESTSYKVTVNVPQSYSGTINSVDGGGSRYDAERGLCYYDFVVEGEVSGATCTVEGIFRNILMSAIIFSSEMIGGKEYYVFYAN